MLVFKNFVMLQDGEMLKIICRSHNNKVLQNHKFSVCTEKKGQQTNDTCAFLFLFYHLDLRGLFHFSHFMFCFFCIVSEILSRFKYFFVKKI